jgi:hypothetical protein
MPGPLDQISSFTASASYMLMTEVARWPFAALPIARALGHGVVVGPSTELVIEGFPRSANSLAVSSFTASGTPPERIAHHTHAPANLIAGVRRGIPSLLVIREPSEAAKAFIASKPSLAYGSAIRGWISFHRALVRYLDGIVVATSEQVAGAMPAVVARLNLRFGSGFPIPDVSQMDRARVGVGDHWARRTGHGLPVLGRGRGGRAAQPGRSGVAASRAQLDGADGLYELLRRASI